MYTRLRQVSASRKVSGVASLPINGGRVFYARTDPRYEITPVTPAGRKKFEGVVAGAWKPFVSLSLRRFVERGAVYHRRASGSSFLLSLSLSLSPRGTSNKSQPIVSRGAFYVRRLLTPFPSHLASSPQSANNSKWFRARIHNLWNALRSKNFKGKKRRRRRRRRRRQKERGGREILTERSLSFVLR